MGIEKKIFGHQSIYWMGMNSNIEKKNKKVLLHVSENTTKASNNAS